ncbi:MAG: uridine kinase, partial [Planctomycetaceae bacterium]
RMRRDITQRGRTPESVLDQYQKTVQPMHDQYVEPGKHSAHLIVPLQAANQSAVNVVAAAVRGAMNDEDQSGS